MTTAKINIKNIDYFKFKKIVIDGNRDDYGNCSKEVKALCDSVQTLSFRDEEFDVQSDRGRFEEVCTYYHQILQSKRIDPLDMRIKSGWWGDHKSSYSAGKIKPAVLQEVLVAKTRDWSARHGGIQASVVDKLEEKIEGPGLYVFKHKEHQCFQYIGRADNVFAKCAETLKAALEGTSAEPLAALLVISMTTDWDFYFIPVSATDSNRILRILENDLILKHDCIWPHGLNFSLHIDSLLEVSEFRKSCLRHHWPPESDAVEEKEIDLNRLRKQVASYATCSPDKPFAAAVDQCNRSDVISNQDEADSDKSNSKKLTRPTTANKATNKQTTSLSSAQKTSAAAAAAPSPSKLSTEKTSSASKSNPKSPAKQTAKQIMDNKETEQVADTSGPSESDSPSTQDDQPKNVTAAPPTLQRSNTFTYSDSDSSDSNDRTKEKRPDAAATSRTPTKPSSSDAKQAPGSRLPSSTQRH